MCNCEKLEKKYEGKTLIEIKGLKDSLKKVTVDYIKWVTIYECVECGQHWKKYYEGKGHGEVPSVEKIDCC